MLHKMIQLYDSMLSYTILHMHPTLRIPMMAPFSVQPKLICSCERHCFKDDDKAETKCPSCEKKLKKEAKIAPFYSIGEQVGFPSRVIMFPP